MKVRQSYVANSSSSSFLISKKNITVEEVEQELRKVLKLYNEMMDTDYRYEDCFGSIYEYTKYDYEADRKQIEKYSTDKYSFNGWGYEKEENIGKIFIDSSEENSIPFELFDIIEKKFNAYRYHLG